MTPPERRVLDREWSEVVCWSDVYNFREPIAEGAMFNHVPIFFRHELLKSTGKLYIIKTHRNTSLYRGNDNPLPIGKIQLYATVSQEFEAE